MSVGTWDPTTTPDAPTAVPPRPAGAPRIGWIGAAIVGTMALVATVGPWLAPHRPMALAGAPLEAPSWAHLLGTNAIGQDLLSQLVTGARVSLVIALVAGVGTLVLGAAVGLTAGWRGGTVDAALMRMVDLLLALPRLPLLIVVGAYIRPSVLSIAVLIAVTSWPPNARVVRSQALSLRGRTHLQAASGFGARTWHVLRRHVIPEVGLILVAGLVSAAGRAVMLEAGLSFLGLGDPNQASWGATLRDALDFGGLFFTPAWSWWLVPPVVAITVVLLGITFLGMGIETKLAPRLARHAGGR